MSSRYQCSSYQSSTLVNKTDATSVTFATFVTFATSVTFLTCNNNFDPFCDDAADLVTDMTLVHSFVRHILFPPEQDPFKRQRPVYNLDPPLIGQVKRLPVLVPGEPRSAIGPHGTVQQEGVPLLCHHIVGVWPCESNTRRNEILLWKTRMKACEIPWSSYIYKKLHSYNDWK